MTEEEFKKTMTIVVAFIVIALIILVIIGIFIFATSKKQKSIFESQTQLDEYKKTVQENNSHNLTKEEVDELENSSEFQEN